VVRRRRVNVTLYIYLLSCLQCRRQLPFRIIQCRRQHSYFVWAAGSQFISLTGQTISSQHQALLHSWFVRMIQVSILGFTEWLITAYRIPLNTVFAHNYLLFSCSRTCIYVTLAGTAVAQRLRCCVTNLKVTGSIPDGVIGIFHWRNPSDRTMAPRSNQPLTEMSTRSISWG